MQLFYHGTRDIELPAAGRRGPPTAVSRHCEACGRELTRFDASESAGAALAFCQDCRHRLDNTATRTHFCDRCEVAVPIEDVEQGRALAAAGRILCRGCRAPRPAAPRILPWGLFLAAAALAAGVLAALLF